MGKNGFCNNCGEGLHGGYCSSCGQKVIEAKDRKLGHFIYQFFGAAFFLERNFLKDLWWLLSAPGKLANDYRAGKRQSHMTPISLFLLINIVYFIFSPVTDLNLSMRDQMYQPLHGKIAEKLINNRLNKESISIDQLSERYANQSTSLSKSMVIVNVPIMALLCSLLYVRKKDYFFGDHMVLTYHLMGFVLLLSCLMVVFYYPIFQLNIVSIDVLSSSSKMAMGLIVILYFFFSIKNFYQDSAFKTVLNTISVIIIFIITHFLYRTILFFSVYYTI